MNLQNQHQLFNLTSLKLQIRYLIFNLDMTKTKVRNPRIF